MRVAIVTRWADTYNPKDVPDECAGGWQAAEKPVFLSDVCADGWRTAEKSAIKGEYVALRRFNSPLKYLGYQMA